MTKHKVMITIDKKQLSKVITALTVLIFAATGMECSCFAEEAKAQPSPVEQIQVSDITKDYVISILQTKETDPELYNKTLNELTDSQYQEFVMYLPAAELAIREQHMILSSPAPEAQGTEYIIARYNIDPQSMSTEEFVMMMHTMEHRNPPAFYDIIGNLSDEMYELYYSANEYYEENDLYESISSIVPFTYTETGTLKSGTAILSETEEGKLKIPDRIIFQICYMDGTQDYVHGNNKKIKYFPEGTEIRVVYTDSDGLTGECLLTKDRHFVFSGEGAEDFIFPISGNTDIFSIGSKLITQDE